MLTKISIIVLSIFLIFVPNYNITINSRDLYFSTSNPHAILAQSKVESTEQYEVEAPEHGVKAKETQTGNNLPSAQDIIYKLFYLAILGILVLIIITPVLIIEISKKKKTRNTIPQKAQYRK